MPKQFPKQDANKLIDWYRTNQRDLPWRNTGDPYDVWLSEIMLQQTRIEAVIPKFISFKEALPTIKDLANVKEDDLLRLWEGLGYYSRATNLKKCAQIIVKEYDGQLPQTYEELIQLPGIGPYTAGAISSIAFNAQHTAMDGNVLRILARYYGIKEDIRQNNMKKELEETILPLYTNTFSSKDFNQALMELGQVICLPNGIPNCKKCPLHKKCYAYINKETDTIPYRSPLKDRKIINRTIFIIKDHKRFVLHKRDNSGVLKNLYEFYGIDKYLSQDEVIQEVEKLGFEVLHIKELPNAKHIFTHLEWYFKCSRDEKFI